MDDFAALPGWRCNRHAGMSVFVTFASPICVWHGAAVIAVGGGFYVYRRHADAFRLGAGIETFARAGARAFMGGAGDDR